MEYPQGKLTAVIIRAIIRVHRVLGPGFLEEIYRKALIKELSLRGLVVDTEKKIRVYYEGEEVGVHRLDLLVEGKVIVELKTVETLGMVHYAQLRSYLKAADLDVGILVNFAREKADFRRVDRRQPSSPHPPISPPSPSSG